MLLDIEFRRGLLTINFSRFVRLRILLGILSSITLLIINSLRFFKLIIKFVIEGILSSL
jgi:hypothetical protein